MRAGLLEAELDDEGGKAVTGRRGKQDAGEIEGVDDLGTGWPDPGRGEKVDVERSRTRSGMKATAPTSMTRSWWGSRPVVSRSRATYSGTG
jgi:hypothetical protein